ncbi:ead/Ea22-like family protein [Escherichia coli]|uniref:ead/Ea22-like family protein n=1 Tax=Escherichia coli TaxID=562 RepID=UPI00158C9ACF|nr:ead/Ea22-like family protein [Escherichia coli]EID9318619.1 ead/Ea22-like family protein [Escherichia coli]EID9328092.1 ead/Ea22-like family protein [Escherichia coli]EID9904865.1 ead/Ea22-like family protein [Escherichia coli]EID9909955.1 ead/Ea22-like family protein [Escherichia coli]EID9914896.1 ead/Ea22-like family protein [Escherichia coli]
MSEINYQVLREAAESASKINWTGLEDDLNADGYMRTLTRYIQCHSPIITLSLLDERNALNERIAELEANLAAMTEDHQRAIESIKQADAAVKLAHEKFSALAAENAGLKAFKTAVYQQMGVGCDAPEFSITTGLSNLRRFADTLHAIEREFFTKELPDEEHEGETFNECPLSWGMSVEQYVSEFRKCLAEVRAQGLEMFAQKCNSKSEQSLASDIRDNWKLLGEHATDFAAQLRKGGNQ